MVYHIHIQLILRTLQAYIDYMEFVMKTGYSVSGFADLFQDADIENPLWEKGE